MRPPPDSAGSTGSGLALAAISIVTPSFNRRKYLAETMDSVIGQDYPKLEYVVVDGASTDGSAELIERRAGELAWWISEPDTGAWEAVNKGFAHTSGEVMGWLGSDDLLMPWSMSIVGEVFATFPQIEWLTSLYPTTCDESGRPVKTNYVDAYSRDAFFRGENLPHAGWPAAGFIQQEATYWRRSLWDRTGGRLDESLKLAADFELWARFHRAGAKLYGIPLPLAAFRVHGKQKSHDLPGYLEEARGVLIRHGGRTPAIPGVPLLRRLLIRVLPTRLRRLGVDALAGLLGTPLPTGERLCVVHDGPGKGWRVEDS